ncbi:MAG: thermosome subunit alpha [Thermoplasmatota archaeon]
MGGTPIFILSEGTKRERGEEAQKRNIAAAEAIADAVRTTLGPKGMDKMLVDSMGDVTITNDGASILKDLDIEHPAAKMMVEIAETQDEECGDGTTSAVILAGELLKNAEDMIGRLHSSTIANGYKLASEKAIDILEELKQEIDIEDERILKNIASTAMTGKSIEVNKEHLADLAVAAVKHIVEKTDEGYEADIDNIKIVKKAGASADKTELIRGIVLDKQRVHDSMPKEIKNAKIALLNTSLEIKKTETKTSIEITSPDQLQKFIDEEEESIKRMVEQIKDSGANVLLCQKDIDDLAQYYLAKEGILAVESISKSDMKKLAKATGGHVVNNLSDLEKEDLGKAGIVHEKTISGDHMVFIEDTKEPRAVSVLLRGGTDHIVDEIDRAIHDALKVVSVAIEDGAILPGGGATEIELSNRIKEFAGTVKGREQLAAEAFAESFTIIPRTIAENAGIDGIDILMDLNAVHERDGLKNHGINLDSGDTEDMVEAGIIEPFRVKKQAIISAREAANMILRIDDVIASKGFVQKEEEDEEDLY